MNPSTPPRNRLLAALPRADWAVIAPQVEEQAMPQGRILVEGGAPFRHLYFPVDGVISTVAVFSDGSSAEMATTGPEGMVGVGAILSSDTSLSRHLVQVPGAALVIGYDAFRRFEREMPVFRAILVAYAQAFLAQVQQSVACNGVHGVEQRAARWLLMCHDRSEGDRFSLTQEFLSEMLGVSRPTVSIVARTLQKAGLIRYSRGRVTIEDRAGLEEASCECYAIIRRQYQGRLEPFLNGRGAGGR